MTKQNAQKRESLDNVRPLIKELLDLTAEKKDIEKEIKELRERILPLIEGRGKMQLDNYVFEAKQMAGRKSLDKSTLDEFLRQHGKTVADFEKVGAPFVQLNVTEAAESI